MIFITSCITIALVYFFHEPGVPYAFFVAIGMEAGFILYIYNYLKEMEESYELKNENNTKIFEKKENQLKEELENVTAELAALNKKTMEAEALKMIKDQKKTLQETTKD